MKHYKIYRKLIILDSFYMHHEPSTWLETKLSDSKTKTNVMVTHMVPRRHSIVDHVANNSLSAAYEINLKNLIKKYQLALCDIWTVS